MASALVGLLVGAMLCFSNMYFGLQTGLVWDFPLIAGWVTMGSLQSALVGFGICRLLRITPFEPKHNVMLQTVAVAAATLPLAGGFVSVIPAMEMLDPPMRLSFWGLVLWCCAIAFFGVFFAVPLRRQVLTKPLALFFIPFLTGTGAHSGGSSLSKRHCHGRNDHSATCPAHASHSRAPQPRCRR